jgi:hypothetical protein
MSNPNEGEILRDVDGKRIRDTSGLFVRADLFFPKGTVFASVIESREVWNENGEGVADCSQSDIWDADWSTGAAPWQTYFQALDYVPDEQAGSFRSKHDAVILTIDTLLDRVPWDRVEKFEYKLQLRCGSLEGYGASGYTAKLVWKDGATEVPAGDGIKSWDVIASIDLAEATDWVDYTIEWPIVDGVPSESIGIALYVDANTCPSSPFDTFHLEANALSMGQNIVYNLES